MIAKVSHLVHVLDRRIVFDIDAFVAAIRDECHASVTTKVVNGGVLWRQFEEAVTAYRTDPANGERQITERVNELAVAKVLIDDPTITWPIA
ncbi:hypothetical protein [Bradyrhizobium sp. SZCCHNRI3042]|uniref:hypothetical protein n=1 Tax=Bradyrhizobium sp. SZCCHNRI3042 TaxID=3057291 RepID=UPI002915C4CC|nr:hypothetical protein [Bradyrhizobium sp. SZCCHNRI3042]